MEIQKYENHGSPIDKQHLNGNALDSSSSSTLEIPFEDKIDDDSNSLSDEGESEVLSLLQLCRKVHQQRLEDVEKNKDLDSNSKYEEKLLILQSYLEQVEEQNDVLASTMVELEKEAQKRVKQMEKRLKTSAKTTMEAVINIHECEKEMRRLVEERLSMETLVHTMQQHLSSLKVENSFLRDQNCNLNHDIQALLHVIHHARSTGHWEMNCVTFCEVTPEQIFGPVQSISQLYSNESPQSDYQPQEGEHKQALNSDFSSQDVSPSSRSSPSLSHQLELSICDGDTKVSYTPDDLCNVRAEQEKKIALLEAKISELQHQLTAKEAECECHLWKLEILMQHNQSRAQTYPCESPTVDSSVQKCISLPDIGNIYSYTKVLRRSHSCRTSGYQANLPSRPIKRSKPHKRSTCSEKPCQPNVAEKSESIVCKYSNVKQDQPPGSNKAQSEPYLFMFGDNVYVYRPCEPIKKASNVALCNDYQLSLPPCQSIDLKFPVDESDLKICDWDHDHKNTISCGVPDSSYHKVDESSSSCSSHDSLDERNSDNVLCRVNSCVHVHQNMCSMQSDCRKCHHEKIMYSSDEEDRNSYVEKFPIQISQSVQTENKVSFQSIGLQADICERKNLESSVATGLSNKRESYKNGDIDIFNGNLFELDLSQLRRTVQSLKDSVLKAEDKAEAKSMLIEQLQGHIASAVQEVEMKDMALNNVEKKLEISRNECGTLKENVSSLNAKIQQFSENMEALQKINEDLQQTIAAKDGRIEELIEEQKMLQNQKRALMTQLDEQGDMYENTKKELLILRSKADEYNLQINLQNQTIQNLQDALVKSKRASDIAFPKSPSSMTNINSNLMSEMKHPSRGSIVDI